ncbi:hypothetical protein FAY30_02305 [Bacillus sp. S3]|uniref:hypothetical protein n=1 Tax=Bacillus sp. S3 TaxID=486398 RepID=UPI00118B6F78|nr:hypothetical protein [Bacillus sp. S3]QCJ40832.1 hypothetical protein FAY30_02305 [Bacillus sp. S3]
MSKKQTTVQEKTSADSKAIGFEYQYFYFLYQLLQLQTGQTVGYEVKDDVHIDKPDGDQILVQLKHSVETRADGNIINLTEKDEDLWKTISNWISIINDPAEKRLSLESQLEFINKTDFQLVTNKSNSITNLFITKLEEYQSGKLSLVEMKAYLKVLSNPKKGKESSKVDTYISTLENQDEKWLESFLNKLRIEHNKDDLINRIKLRIKEKNVKSSRIDDVFVAVNSRLKEIIYEDIKAGKKVKFTFDEYDKHFTRLFELGRSIKLPIILSNKRVPLPENPQDYTVIKQLLDVQILSKYDADYEENLVNIFTSKYEMHNHLLRWLQNSEITEDVKREFDEETKSQWTTIFNSTYSKLKRKLRGMSIEEIDNDELLDLASQCYFETLKLKLSIDDTPINTTMSYGQLYLLSDIPVIGWDYRWKERFAK